MTAAVPRWSGKRWHAGRRILLNKKLVIWEFTERDIRSGIEGWQIVPPRSVKVDSEVTDDRMTRRSRPIWIVLAVLALLRGSGALLALARVQCSA